MATFSPLIRLSNVDFPVFRRPINEAYPVFILGSDLRLRRQAHADLMDATAFGFKNLDLQSIDVERLTDGRHAADAREHVAADGLESLRLHLDTQPITHLVDVHLRAPH